MIKKTSVPVFLLIFLLTSISNGSVTASDQEQTHDPRIISQFNNIHESNLIGIQHSDNGGIKPFLFDQCDPDIDDCDPPSVYLNLPEPDGNQGWYKSPVYARVFADDPESGVEFLFISWQTGKWYPSGFLMDEDGIYRIYGYARDKVGNYALTPKVIVKIDTTPPEITIYFTQPDGRNGWYISPMYIEASGEDTLSGMDEIRITIDNLESELLDLLAGDKNSALSFNKTVVLDVDGHHEVVVSAYDIAGNITEEKLYIDFDSTPPTAFMHTQPGLGGKILLSGSVADEASGSAKAFIDVGKGWEQLELKDNQWQFEWDTQNNKVSDGYYQVGVRVIDIAGNSSESYHKVEVLNHPWPFITLSAFVFAIGVTKLIDPRPAAWQELASMIQRMRRFF